MTATEKLDEGMAAITLQPSDQEVPKVPPCGNLPLPRELRDHIWSYLLHHDYVKAAPYYTRTDKADTRDNGRNVSSTHSYSFTTSILSVNKQIQAEALEILKQNTFIVISYVWPQLGWMKDIWSLPIVTEDQNAIAKFDGHVMRVHLQCAQKDLSDEEKKVGSLIILVNELEMFCEMIQWRFLGTKASLQIIGHPEGTPPGKYNIMFDAAPPGVGVVKIQFQLRSTTYKELTAGMQAELLKPFELMNLSGQKVTGLNGLADQEMVRSLKEVMSPKSIWLEALAWNMLEAGRKLKARADELVRQGDYYRASDKYWLMYKITENNVLLRLGNNPQWLPPDVALPAGLFARMVLDGLATSGFLYYKLGDIGEMHRAANNVASMGMFLISLPGADELGLLPKGEGRMLVHPEARWFGTLTTFLIASKNEDRRHKHDVCSRTAESLRLAQSVLRGDEYLAMDLGVVKSTWDDPERLKAYLDGTLTHMEWIEQTSAYQRPARIFDTPLPAGLNKPEGLRGLQDIEHRAKILEAGAAPI